MKIVILLFAGIFFLDVAIDGSSVGPGNYDSMIETVYIHPYNLTTFNSVSVHKMVDGMPSTKHFFKGSFTYVGKEGAIPISTLAGKALVTLDTGDLWFAMLEYPENFEFVRTEGKNSYRAIIIREGMIGLEANLVSPAQFTGSLKPSKHLNNIGAASSRTFRHLLPSHHPSGLFYFEMFKNKGAGRGYLEFMNHI